MIQWKAEVRRIGFEDSSEGGGGPLLPSRPRLRLGTILITANALDALNQEDVVNALRRHRVGDWGIVEPEDWEANRKALEAGWRILSVYRDRNRTRFYIITQADRSVTTVMLPEDY